MSGASFSQTGIIDSVLENSAIVRIECYSSCASCHAKEGCTSNDKQDRLIEAPLKGRTFKTGQSVIVSTPKSDAFKAVVWAYLIPFIILIVSLFIFLTQFSETIAGLLSLATLAPYYLGLYLARNVFKRKFEFEIN